MWPSGCKGNWEIKKTGYGSVAKRWTLIQWLTAIVASSSSSAAANTSYR